MVESGHRENEIRISNHFLRDAGDNTYYSKGNGHHVVGFAVQNTFGTNRQNARITGNLYHW